ncbi:hypothetical protein [Streptomyces sp. V4I2]|uniref:hypothetical protein n=1 Tax=Streptomyces sp. V4I2 TaxID=3042280 RepID=UPI00277F798F|nr:hypothetical protein [Streptomyces sp. V4I2]MDQ1052000.1 hypothetical protein [Streptomyces sp. V4I2]
MMMKTLGLLSDLAEGQSGMITAAQADSVGADELYRKGLVVEHVIEQVLPDVWRLRGGARHPFPRLYAHWLLLHPEQPAWERPIPASGVASHGAALRVYGVGNLPGPEAEFIVPDTAGVEPTRLNVIVHQTQLAADEVTERTGLPVTTPGRTLADLAAGADFEHLGRIATTFLRQGAATEEDLAQGLHRAMTVRGQTGSGTEYLDALLAGVDGTESIAS